MRVSYLFSSGRELNGGSWVENCLRTCEATTVIRSNRDCRVKGVLCSPLDCRPSNSKYIELLAKGTVVISCINSPLSVTLSGDVKLLLAMVQMVIRKRRQHGRSRSADFGRFSSCTGARLSMRTPLRSITVMGSLFRSAS